MRRFEGYVGLPWRDRGRSTDGCDCWGLLRLVYAGELAIDLPDRANSYQRASDPAVDRIVADCMPDWKRVAANSERAPDVLLFRQAPWHVGIVVGRGMMLHIPERRTSCIEPYTTGRWGGRLEGIYRHGTQAT